MADPGSMYDVVTPEARPAKQSVELIPPVTDLTDAVVAQLWDYRFRGDDMFPILEEELGRRFKGIQFIGYEEIGETHAKNEHEVLDHMASVLRKRGVTAVISAVGA